MEIIMHPSVETIQELTMQVKIITTVHIIETILHNQQRTIINK